MWLDNWNQFGTDALADDEKSGRPPILTAQEQAQAVAVAMKNPKFPHHQLSGIKEETGKEISQYTLSKLPKKKTVCGSESS